MKKRPTPDDVRNITDKLIKYLLEDLGPQHYASDATYFLDCAMYALPSAMINMMSSLVKAGAFNADLVRRDLSQMEKVLVKMFEASLDGKAIQVNVSEGDA